MKAVLFKILLLMLILAMITPCLPVSAETVEMIDDITELGSEYYIICDTDKDMLSYMPGDPVTFTVKLYSRKKQITVPYLLYTIERDDGSENSGHISSDKNGSYVISDQTMDIPGYVRLLIDFPDENGAPSKKALKENQRSAFEGGVLVDIENITTINKIPRDFKSFWDDSLALLDSYSPDPIELVLAEENTNCSIYEVYINCYGDSSDLKSGETFAAGYLSVPKNKKAGSLPIHMSFQGYGEKGASKSQSSSAIVMNMCAHSFPLGLDKYDASLFELAPDETRYGWSETVNRDREDVYYRNMILRNVQAARFLMKYFGEHGGGQKDKIGNVDISYWNGLWNGKDLKVSGGSQGGFQSISLAALCPNVSHLTASIPWFGNVASGTYTAPTGDTLGSTFIPPYAPGLDYYDTAFFASYVNCDTVITGGMGDMTCSPTALMAMYNNIRQNKNINVSITMKQGMTHMFRPEPEMVASTCSQYKSEITSWNIDNGVLNVSGNGTVTSDLPQVKEWCEKLDGVKEINIMGNITGLGENVFPAKSGTDIYIKISEPIAIDGNAFGGVKDIDFYYTEASKAGAFADSTGITAYSIGTVCQSGAFSYAVDGDILRIFSLGEDRELTVTSADFGIINLLKDNFEKIKAIEIRGKFSSVGNMQPAFSELEKVTDIKIDSRNKALSGEKNFMGLKSLVTLGHFNFAENIPTTFSEGTVDLTGFDICISDRDTAAIPTMLLSGCSSVKRVIMPAHLMLGDADGAGIISEKVFAGCSSLETVEFPESVTLSALNFAVFSKCTSLKKVIVRGDVSSSFSCIFKLGSIQSFDGVPETAVFEVTSDENAGLINKCFDKGGLGLRAVSNGSAAASASAGLRKGTVIIVVCAAVSAIAAVTAVAVVLIKKKNKAK